MVGGEDGFSETRMGLLPLQGSGPQLPDLFENGCPQPTANQACLPPLGHFVVFLKLPVIITFLCLRQSPGSMAQCLAQK